MDPKKRPGFARLVLVLSLALMLLGSGCMGRYAAWSKVEEVNLNAVENRYARQVLFWLMSPIYSIASLTDVLIFNPLEFWTGTNEVDGGEAEVDIDM